MSTGHFSFLSEAKNLLTGEKILSVASQPLAGAASHISDVGYASLTLRMTK